MEGQSSHDQRLEQLASIIDPSELIIVYRRLFAEENHLQESDLFPMDEDDAGKDLAYVFFGMWLALYAPLPLERQEQVVAEVERMAAVVQGLRQEWPADPVELKREVLHCLRRGVNPSYWPRSV